MARTTVILKENLMLEVKQLARAKQTTATQIIHEALTAYVEAVKTATLPSFVAAGRSGKRSVSKSAETLLRRGLGRNRKV